MSKPSLPPRPKTSIFDLTAPGLAPAPPQAAAEPLPAGARKPKASIFDQTLAGDVTVGAPSAPPAPRRWWQVWRKAETPAPVSEFVALEGARRLPARPTRTVTLPTLPDPDPAMARLLDEAIAEATGVSEAPVAEEAFPAPASPEAVVSPEGEPWEEGTAAEWNPRWASARRAPLAPPADEAVAAQPTARRPWGLLLAAAALLLVAGGAFSLLLRPRGAEVATAAAPSPEWKAYLDRAQAGDVGAMRMVGIRYAYGLQAPVNRPEGVRWLRRAAEAGSEGARRELAALEGGR